MAKQFTALDEESRKGRLQAFREVLGKNASQPGFASDLGMTFKRWNEYERGYPLPTKAYILIRERFPIPGLIEWLMFGDDSGLDKGLARELAAAQWRKTVEAQAKLDEQRKANRRIRVLLNKKRDSSAV